MVTKVGHVPRGERPAGAVELGREAKASDPLKSGEKRWKKLEKVGERGEFSMNFRGNVKTFQDFSSVLSAF